MKKMKRILSLSQYLLFGKDDKRKEQILKYAEYTIKHTTIKVEKGRFMVGFKTEF